MLEDAAQALLEDVDVVVDEVLLVDFGLRDQTHQSQALVHLPQVQNDILAGIRVAQFDEA